MLLRFIDFLTPLLQIFPPEVSHTFALKSLRLLNYIGFNFQYTKSKPRKIFGVEFKNQVGLAAGLDKNGDYIGALSSLGFGFIEVGTVTPRPQEGNPKPRLFRHKRDLVLVNKMGFNNKGVDHLVERIKKTRLDCVLGISIGKNFDTSNEDALKDYLECLNKVYEFADYVAINISSPNTKDLRALQTEKYLEDILESLVKERDKLEEIYGYKPLILKVSPDLKEEEIKFISRVVKLKKLDGVICTNTSNVHDYEPKDAGMSGAALLELSNIVLSHFRKYLGKDFPIIASGGVLDLESYHKKISLGADLVQLYTGIIYKGPGLVHKLVNETRDF
tara:strand:- start:286 stop:1284 length:999 start_codon:yes stop_codon:yes gene_type:complete